MSTDLDEDYQGAWPGLQGQGLRSDMEGECSYPEEVMGVGGPGSPAEVRAWINTLVQAQASRH